MILLFGQLGLLQSGFGPVGPEYLCSAASLAHIPLEARPTTGNGGTCCPRLPMCPEPIQVEMRLLKSQFHLLLITLPVIELVIVHNGLGQAGLLIFLRLG